ncbi:PKD domain-containing protein [Kitasatospora aureofaciens]|uniref:PKD domain-containing protein n=1 Tax=Kitasatospora aureofaciens TaxID=1894 RepID=UPI001C458462|nr:PKD domain-containing protein [Kitasatospora aureofaciens]MBV6702307.1 PKD domain-containing protein [Kitasatospora aureofaciens]
MRISRALGLTAAAATVVLGTPLPAFAEPAATLYVNNVYGSNCSDAGVGTQAQPFCTISKAAQAVEPGQTVEVNWGGYNESVTLTRSGTPDKPITFVGMPWTAIPDPQPELTPRGTAAGITVSGAHDVVIRGFQQTSHGADAVLITNSHHVTVDQNTFDIGSANTRGVRVTGQSDHITVSRSTFGDAGGVAIEAGSHDIVVTTNEFNGSYSGITAADSPGLVATGNTVGAPCGPGIALNGGSAGAVIENNIVTAQVDSAGPGAFRRRSCDAAGGAGDTGITVSAESTRGTKIDYNVVHPAGGSAYSWGGTRYPSPETFTAATGQAAHDRDQKTAFLGLPTRLELADTDTAAIDTADPDVPGMLPTDLTGRPAIHSPLVPAGSGNSTGRDRGARERQGLDWAALTTAGATVTTAKGPAPFDARITATAQNSWPTAPTYSFDFGDGSRPLVTTESSVVHTYPTVGTFQPTVTVTDGLGSKVTSLPSTDRAVTVSAPGELVSKLSLYGRDLHYTFDATRSTSPYQIKNYTVDFGDGTTGSAPAPFASVSHDYPRTGRYTATMTITDEGGRTATTGETFDVAYDTMADRTWGERVQLLAQTTGETLNANANYTRGHWNPFARLRWPEPDRPATALAETFTSNDVLRAFKIYNGALETADQTLDTRLWGEWLSVPLTGIGRPITQVVAAPAGGVVHVVVLTTDGRIYESVADYPAGRWTPWGDITAAAGLPAGATGLAAGFTGNTNTLHVAALGADGRVRIADGNYTKGTWWSGDLTSVLGNPGGITQLSGTVLRDRFHLLAVADGSIHQAAADYAAGSWNGWNNVSAVTGLSGGVTRVAAASTGNTLRLYALSGGHVYDAGGDYNKGVWSPFADATVPGAAGAQAPISVLAAAGIG